MSDSPKEEICSVSCMSEYDHIPKKEKEKNAESYDKEKEKQGVWTKGKGRNPTKTGVGRPNRETYRFYVPH